MYKSLYLLLGLLPILHFTPVRSASEFKVSFVNVAKQAGLTHKTIYGDEHKNKYLLETTGSGVAWFDYDNDGWLDLFFVNGTRLNGFPKGQEPTAKLYKNNRNGSFTDVTAKAGLGKHGGGQAFSQQWQWHVH
jgi:enediyne biosynthesis protein E4